MMTSPYSGLNRMIFSRLFKPSHTSADPQKRINAVNELSPEKSGDKTVLHELAFNDEDHRVSLAALRKLDSFALWQKVAKTTRYDALKREAIRQVEQAVLSAEHPSVSQQVRIAYLEESAGTDLIIKVLQLVPPRVTDDDVVCRLLSKVGRPNFTIQYFVDYASHAQQERLLEEIHDEQTLQKLVKKTGGIAIQKRVMAKLSHLKDEKERPVQVERQATLVLSKYQALVDKADLTLINARMAAFESEFAAIAEDFVCLDTLTRQTLLDKHSSIAARIRRHAEQLRPQWEARIREQKATEAVQSLRACISTATSSVDAIYNALCQATMDEVAQAEQTIGALQGAMLTAREYENQERVQSLLREAKNLEHRFDRFTQQQQKGHAVFQVLQEAQAADSSPVDEQGESDWAQLESRWRETTAELDHIPEGWLAAFRESRQHWKNAKASKKAQRQHALKGLRKQLNIIDNLIDNGKFNPAIAKFRRLRDDKSTLDSDVSAEIDKRFAQTQMRVERLEGWQDYLAAPRKPELIEQARQLAESPATDIHGRSAHIKALRKQWMSLSHADENDALKDQFDIWLEQAFEPCRQYFKVQDEKRQQGASQRQALIEQMRALSDNPPELPALYKESERLKTKWHQSQHTDPQTYQALKAQWESVLQPVQDVLQKWFADNRSQKQALIVRATSLADGELSSATAEDAKALQAQWKTVGHAGSRHESKLWQAFRHANDTIFSHLKAQRDAALSEEDATFSQLSSQLDALNDSYEPSRLTSLSNEVNTLLEGCTLSSTKQTALHKKADAILRNWRKTAQAESAARRDDAIEDLKQVIKASVNSDGKAWEPEAVENSALPAEWRMAMRAVSEQNVRPIITLKLEILVKLESPEHALQQRQDIQVQMLADKLGQGETLSGESLVADWLRCGPVQADESALAERFCRILDVLKAI